MAARLEAAMVQQERSTLAAVVAELVLVVGIAVGIMVVTAAGNLEIYLGSETGTSVSAQANAVLLVTQIA